MDIHMKNDMESGRLNSSSMSCLSEKIETNKNVTLRCRLMWVGRMESDSGRLAQASIVAKTFLQGCPPHGPKHLACATFLIISSKKAPMVKALRFRGFMFVRKPLCRTSRRMLDMV